MERMPSGKDFWVINVPINRGQNMYRPLVRFLNIEGVVEWEIEVGVERNLF